MEGKATVYILRRFLQTSFVLFGVSVVTFLMLHVAPGHPLQSNPEMRLDPTAVERWLHLRQLDRPLFGRYISWLSRLFRGDFGVSLLYNRPVTELMAERLPSTLLLTVTAFVISLLLAVLIGTYAARYQDSACARVVNILSIAGNSLPDFWLGILLVLVFSYKNQLFPAAGMRTPGDGSPADIARHMVLPLSVMVFANFSYYVRYVRGAVLAVLKQDFVRAAKSRGLNDRQLLFRHVLPNAAIPVVTIAALSLPMLFTGTMTAEYVFAWPGIGRFIVSSLLARDYPVVMTVNLYTACLVALANLLADLLYLLIDPRLRVKR
ncbi:MAG: ABC transporter permease [Bacillota bacterium]|jgi:peptide/nickel transport system permease protein|nr:ABC transporter permease [Bacillota bacterium]